MALIRYVAGVLTRDPQMSNLFEVVYMDKLHPEWMKGRANLPGGKVRAGESLAGAMAREFHEECGLLLPADRWRRFCTLVHAKRNGIVHFFVAHADPMEAEQVCKMEEEPVYWSATPPAHSLKNLSWLVPMALDPDSVTASVVDASV